MLDHASRRRPRVQPKLIRPPASEEYISYGDILRFLERYWLTIALTSMASLVAALLYLLLAQPMFTARAQILIDPRMPSVVREQVGETSIALDSPQVESQIAVLRSEELGAKVIDALGLLDDSEFQPKQPSDLMRMLGSLWAWTRTKSPPLGSDRELPSGDDMAAQVALAIFLDRLDVRRVGMSYAIELSFTSIDPDKAARVANTVAEAYVADQLATRARAARQGSDWLEERIEQIKLQMNEANLRVQEFKARRDYRIIGNSDASRGQDAGSSPLSDTVQVRRDINTLEALESTAQTYRKIYEMFLEAFAEAVQRQSFPFANARIITKATKPFTKSHPKPKLVLALGLLVGTMAGCGIALVRNSMDGSVRSPRQIREELGIECLGQLPRLNAKEAKRRFAIVHDAPSSRFSDGVKRVKTAIRIASKAQPIHSLGVTSALPGEGKSTIAANLAMLSATSGMRTLLVDADIRNSTLSRALAPEATAGLVDVLIGSAADGECIIQHSSMLDVLPAARKEPVKDSSDLLGSEAMRQLLSDLRKTYNVVIVDLPPVHALADSLAVSSLIDSVILLAEWGQTPFQMLVETAYTLRTAQASMLGVVLTKVDPSAIYSARSSYNYYY